MSRDITELAVKGCGVCGAAFADEADLRRHTARVDDDGDSHDGEPWYATTIRVGSVWRWVRDSDDVTLTRITRIHWSGEEWWITSSEKRFGVVMNELEHFTCMAEEVRR